MNNKSKILNDLLTYENNLTNDLEAIQLCR